MVNVAPIASHRASPHNGAMVNAAPMGQWCNGERGTHVKTPSTRNIRAARAHQWFRARVRDERPIPTWVEIDLRDVPGQPGATHLRLMHRGFRSGGPWDEALAYFWRQWGSILGRLGAVCSR